MSYDDSDDLSYNPFADQRSNQSHSGGSSSLVQAHYSSAYLRQANVSLSPPSLRRRRSASTDQASSKINGLRGKHSRTFTDIQVDAPQGAGLHPLKSALAKIDSSSAEDLGNTRPTLSRIVNEGSLSSLFASEDDVNGRTVNSAEEEKDVIIHQISPKDSLPGVALKYGISMSDLRRANRLWTSDSIHRREVLYIPVDQASRAAEYIATPLITFTPDEPSSSTTSPPRATSDTTTEQESSGSSLRSPPAPVRRIPANQLSYFPPSLRKNTSSPIPGSGPSPSPSHAGGAKPLHNWYNSSPASNSFTSILTALPIAASTRDELITRLSFDSVSSSFSDKSRTSRRNSEEDLGHELNEVQRPHDAGNNEDPFGDFAMPTPKASYRTSHLLPSVKKSTNISSVPHSQRHYSSMSPPQFYVSQTNETFVRTSQLEPSPAMKLPSLASRNISRTPGKNIPRLERTSSLPLQPNSKNHSANDSAYTLDTFGGS